MRSIQRGIATSIILILFLIVGIAAASGYFIFSQNQQKIKAVNSFDDCQKAGYPVGESYPAQCWTPDGKRFVQELSDEEKKKLVPPNQINSFEDCQKAGYPVTKSYPSTCSTPEGKRFLQELSEEEKEGLKPPKDNLE